MKILLLSCEIYTERLEKYSVVTMVQNNHKQWFEFEVIFKNWGLLISYWNRFPISFSLAFPPPLRWNNLWLCWRKSFFRQPFINFRKEKTDVRKMNGAFLRHVRHLLETSKRLKSLALSIWKCRKFTHPYKMSEVTLTCR